MYVNPPVAVATALNDSDEERLRKGNVVGDRLWTESENLRADRSECSHVIGIGAQLCRTNRRAVRWIKDENNGSAPERVKRELSLASSVAFDSVKREVGCKISHFDHDENSLQATQSDSQTLGEHCSRDTSFHLPSENVSHPRTRMIRDR